MRLIDADVAIGGVKNRCLGQNDVVKVEHSIISMLYMMPTIEIEPQWIPCSERLPEELIRCKDCRFSRSTNKKNVLTCIIHGFGVHVDPEGFCDSAKEKGGSHA